MGEHVSVSCEKSGSGESETPSMFGDEFIISTETRSVVPTPDASLGVASQNTTSPTETKEEDSVTVSPSPRSNSS